jgi:restriction system protein
MDLLIETIPLLCRSKVAVLAFFRGCGVPDNVTADLRRRVETDKTAITKYEITRTVLVRLNERGHQALAQRRQVVKRVTEFEDFSTCWDNDQLKAQGLVTRVRSVVNVKDSFTCLNQEYERERLERQRQQEAQAQAIRRQREERESLRRRLIELRSISVPRQRGLALEGVLNDIFKLDGLSIREAFTLSCDSGEVGEQIDGLVVMDGHPILVEAKWHARALGVDGVCRHIARVLLREPGVQGRGLKPNSWPRVWTGGSSSVPASRQLPASGPGQRADRHLAVTVLANQRNHVPTRSSMLSRPTSTQPSSPVQRRLLQKGLRQRARWSGGPEVALVMQ